MGRLSNADREALSVFVPAVRDPGGFVPQYCCLCARRLTQGGVRFFEGPVCVVCVLVIRQQTFIRPDNDPRAEGGLG